MTSNFQKTVLVTGGTSGLGYHCALAIARQHPEYQVVIASRSDPNDSAGAINSTLHQNNVRFLSLDLSKLAKVRSFVSEWEACNFPPVHAFVFNAALQFPGDVDYTDDGFEKTFGISHVGHALLFGLLRPHLAKTARIVIVSSGTHDPEQRSGMPDAVYNSAEELAHPTAETSKNKGRQRYTSTKLANVLYTYALHQRFVAINQKNKEIHWTATAFDPGLMPGTGLARDASGLEKFLWLSVLPKLLPLLRLLLSPNIHSPEESGEALARLAVGADVEGKSGVYYEGLKEIKSSKASYVREKQEDLWQWTTGALATSEAEKTLLSLRELL
ncbi:putative short-chain dehydrogenase [Thelonectria olida]|uniref:Short-chain dehydrogenase n=1 Tax=Thelonectria olida TaxID=1576542 RepID=A0A9P8W0L1_9HYPO|nr:putative short-chain dehydrogenase [Thelonectria olida]